MAPFHPELLYIRPQHEIQKTREISGTAYIDFPVSRMAILPDYRNNLVELAKITGTIDSVRNDDDIIIKSVSIKGFASPESPYENNQRLAKGRTSALKDYIQYLYHFPEGTITTDFEAEDWAGLEKYVMESSLPNKDSILEAIRSDRDPDTREWIIKSRYKEDYRHLLDHCYPALRHSDYKIEYTIKSYTTPEEIETIFRTSPHKLSLEEFYVLAQTYQPASEEFNELFETAVRMYPNDPVANLNAANSAILRKDYRRALRYLENAGNLPEAIYARGALEVFMGDNDAARPYLKEAMKQGIPQAETALQEIAKNRFLFKMTINN
jgi:tetratricopeptide (TPR) repeat protein